MNDSRPRCNNDIKTNSFRCYSYYHHIIKYYHYFLTTIKGTFSRQVINIESKCPLFWAVSSKSSSLQHIEDFKLKMQRKFKTRKSKVNVWHWSCEFSINGQMCLLEAQDALKYKIETFKEQFQTFGPQCSICIISCMRCQWEQKEEVMLVWHSSVKGKLGGELWKGT